jgi:hypothetical protein
MPRFKHRPTEVEAWQFTENTKDQVFHNLTGNVAPAWDANGKPMIKVTTVHGEIALVRVGDWVIADEKPGTYYPCKPDIFEATYDAV